MFVILDFIGQNLIQIVLMDRTCISYLFTLTHGIMMLVIFLELL